MGSPEFGHTVTLTVPSDDGGTLYSPSSPGRVSLFPPNWPELQAAVSLLLWYRYKRSLYLCSMLRHFQLPIIHSAAHGGVCDYWQGMINYGSRTRFTICKICAYTHSAFGRGAQGALELLKILSFCNECWTKGDTQGHRRAEESRKATQGYGASVCRSPGLYASSMNMKLFTQHLESWIYLKGISHWEKPE